MSKLVKILDKILAFFAFIFSSGYVLVVLIQIVSRTFLPKTPAWTEELARYLFIYAIASAAGLAVRANAYVAVDILTSKIPKHLTRYYNIALNAALMLFAAFFLFKSVTKFAFFPGRLVSTALEIPMQYIYFGMVVLFSMLVLCYLCEVVLLIQGKKIMDEEETA